MPLLKRNVGGNRKTIFLIKPLEICVCPSHETWVLWGENVVGKEQNQLWNTHSLGT